MIRTILPLVLELFYNHVLFPAYLLVTSQPASPPAPSPNKGSSLHSSLGEPFFEELEQRKQIKKGTCLLRRNAYLGKKLLGKGWGRKKKQKPDDYGSQRSGYI